MSFLEFVTRRLFGPPVSGSCWRCPFCGGSSASFSVRPPKEGHAVKFRCFACDTWGDEYDLMKEAFPGEDYPRRRVRVDRWKKDYAAEQPAAADSDVLSSGDGESRKRQDDSDAVGEAWDNLQHELQENETSPAFALSILNTTQAFCEKAGVSVDLLITYWENFEEWKVESEMEHLATCTDEECDARICRAERGLPSLSREEIEQEKVERELERKAAKEAQRKRIHKALAPVRALKEAAAKKVTKKSTKKTTTKKPKKGKR